VERGNRGAILNGEIRLQKPAISFPAHQGEQSLQRSSAWLGRTLVVGGMNARGKDRERTEFKNVKGNTLTVKSKGKKKTLAQ